MGQVVLARARQRRILSAVLIAVLGLVVVGNSDRTQAASGQYGVDLFVVTNVKKDQLQPRVSGSMIVWKDYRNVSNRRVDDSPNAQIYGLDLNTNLELRVESKDSGDPAIFGNLVAWTAGGGKNNHVEAVDLTDGNVF